MNLFRQIKVSSPCVRNEIKNTPQLIIESTTTIHHEELGTEESDR